MNKQTIRRWHPLAVLAAAAFGPWLAGGASAAEEAAAFPSHTARIIVPFTPGGTGDLLPRAIAEKISADWRHPVIIENRAGAGGNIGAQAAAQAAPDGYTILASPPGPLAINESIYRKLGYDPANFVPISVFATVPIVLAVRATLPVASVQELVQLAKSQPGKLNYASAGNGSTPHLVASMFSNMTGLDLVHVPYKGSTPALNALVSGQADVFFDNLTNALQFHLAGRIRILAVASNARVPSLPDVPTVIDSGIPGFTASTWYAAAAPAGTPAPVVQKWNAAVNRALARPDIAALLTKWGAQIEGGTPEDAARFIRAEAAKWQKVAAAANVTID